MQKAPGMHCYDFLMPTCVLQKFSRGDSLMVEPPVVVNKEVAFKYCPTNYQLADTFTKSLDKDKFVQFRDAILGPMP